MSSNVTYYPLDAPDITPTRSPSFLERAESTSRMLSDTPQSCGMNLTVVKMMALKRRIHPRLLYRFVLCEEDCTGGIQIAYSTPDVDQDSCISRCDHLSGKQSLHWSSVFTLVKQLLLNDKQRRSPRILKEASKDSQSQHYATIFRVETDPMMLGKIVGKGGRNIKNMIKYVTGLMILISPLQTTRRSL